MITKKKAIVFLASIVALYSCDTGVDSKNGESDSPTVAKGENTDKYDNFTDWAIYRGDKKANQYSELGQINAANVHALEPVWEYKHGDPDRPSMYSNPIVVNGLMYFTTPKLHVVAIDAVTGKEEWVFDPAPYSPDKKDFRGRSRGVTYWEDANGKNGRIFN